MKRLVFYAVLGMFFISQATYSQSKRKKAEPEQPQVTAEQLIQNYQFEKAVKQLQREISAAQRSGKSTERLEADLHRANLGLDMLHGTEKVMFVDSLVVPRESVVQSLRLARHTGQLLPFADVVEKFAQRPEEAGETAFINQLADRIYFSAATQTGAARTLCTAYAVSGQWTAPQPLDGLEADDEEQDYPFVMPDGMTIYYAAQGEESLGGYDIFITRYDPGTKRYLKAENVGMPFNSPANDYLMGIDEASGLGWFVTDRNQPADSACIYVFVQSESREVYGEDGGNGSELTSFARITSIADTQTDEDALKLARKSLAEAQKNIAEEQSVARRYVINDHTVYTSLSSFRSDAARRIAERLDEVNDKLQSLLGQQADLQRKAAQGQRSSEVLNKLKQLEQSIPQMRQQCNELAKNMRKAELQ